MLGVLPCGGEGLRWGGITKELIPTSENRWLVDNSIDAMKFAGVDRICVVTLDTKIHILAKHFKKEKYSDCDIFYVIQKKHQSMWEAIKSSFPYAEDLNLFAMTDTIFDKDIFAKILATHIDPTFALGTFATKTPERFGIIIENEIYEKPQHLIPGKYISWGTVVWSKIAVDEWMNTVPKNHTDAFNIAIKQFGLNTNLLNNYQDFASWSDYELWIKSTLVN